MNVKTKSNVPSKFNSQPQKFSHQSSKIYVNSNFDPDLNILIDTKVDSIPSTSQQFASSSQEPVVPDFQDFNVHGHVIENRSPKSKQLFPISSERLVKSIATQTIKPLNIKHNVSTQTAISNTEDIIFINSLQFLLHTEEASSNLPIVKLKVGGLPQNFLLDSGASVSVISKSYFDSVKDQVHFKRISTTVKIATVNSAVFCAGCIKLSFKIGKTNFKHNFFLIDVPETSKFVGILGFDFLKTHRVLIDLENSQVKFNDCQVDIFGTIPEENAEEVRVNNITEVSSQACQATDANSSSIPSRTDNESSSLPAPTQNSKCDDKQAQCTLKSKAIIPPHATVYVFLNTIQDFPSHSGFFQPKQKQDQKICVYNSLVHIDQCASKSKQAIPTYEFAIPIYNDSNVTQHVNKGTVLGTLHPVDEIREDEDSKPEQAQINLIQASPEIIKLRKEEFDIKKFALNHLPASQKRQMQELLSSFDTVFSSSLKSLGHTDHVVPHIQFTSDVPVKTLPYPVPESMQEEIKAQIDALQEAGIIERSISEWACPMLAVKKKTSSPNEKPEFRLALDLRLINSMIRSSSYPLPRIDTIINNISKYRYFTTLDFPSAYHQIHLPKKFRRRLSFTTQWGTFSFRRLMFGLRSAASSFQMLIDAIIEEAKQAGIFSYQDDVIVGANSFQEMIDKLKALFQIFQKYNITLSSKKSQFFQESIDYLGFHIENHKISPISSNITKITAFPIPKTRKHLRRFIGVCGFYRRILPKYAELMDELIKLTSPKTPFKWTDHHTEIFQKV